MACICVEKLNSFCLRLRRRSRSGRSKRRSIKISDPFDFVHVSNLPSGYNEDEINVLKEKAAASRLIPMEDRHLLPPSPIMTSPAAVSPATMSCSYFANSHSTPHLPPPKSRAGYRGLAASTGAAFYNHNASESQRPSIAHSLATVDDVTATTALSPTSSVTTASSRSGWKRG